MGLLSMPAAKRTAPAGSAAPARRVSTRRAGPAVSAASSMDGVVGTTVFTDVPLWHRRWSDVEKARNRKGVTAALCGLDLGPPIGGRRATGVVPRTVDPLIDPP